MKKLHDLGIKCIATRTIGYDHIDVEYAKKLGLGPYSYSPNSVADYTIMMMLMGCHKMKHGAAAIGLYLKGKLGRELRLHRWNHRNRPDRSYRDLSPERIWL